MSTVQPFAPRFHAGFREQPLSQLCDLLMNELVNPTPFSRLYVECLAHAFATRYISASHAAASSVQADARSSEKAANHVIEKIEAGLNEHISVESLAVETGYNRAHFLRLFSATTGTTPHRYVLRARLERPRHLIKRSNAGIIDIALESWFLQPVAHDHTLPAGAWSHARGNPPRVLFVPLGSAVSHMTKREIIRSFGRRLSCVSSGHYDPPAVTAHKVLGQDPGRSELNEIPRRTAPAEGPHG